MSRKKFESTFELFFVEISTSDGKTTGQCTIVSNGVTVRQVLKDGQWVNADPPPPRTRKVQSNVVQRKALPAPEAK